MAPKSLSTKIASVLTVSAGLALGAVAADEPKEASAGGPRVTVEKERVRCMNANKRIPCENGTRTRVVAEQDLAVKIDIAPKQSASCAATVNVESQQRDTIARVTGIIENQQCAVSGGDYVLAVTIRTADGERKTLEFPQTWQRGDDKPLSFTHDLPIGPNVDLVSVRPRGLRCTCTEPAAE
jgi:hypothetical protein